MKLKTSTRQIIDIRDFDNLVEETYGRPYSLQQQNFMGQETYYDFEVPESWDGWDFDGFEGYPVPFKEWCEADPEIDPKTGRPWSPSYEKRLHWEREFYPDFEELMHDLNLRGELDPGKYSIHVWW